MLRDHCRHRACSFYASRNTDDDRATACGSSTGLEQHGGDTIYSKDGAQDLEEHDDASHGESSFLGLRSL